VRSKADISCFIYFTDRSVVFAIGSVDMTRRLIHVSAETSAVQYCMSGTPVDYDDDDDDFIGMAANRLD